MNGAPSFAYDLHPSVGNFLAFSAEQKKNVPRVDEGQVHSNEREIVFTTGSHFLLPLIRCVVKDSVGGII